MPGCRNLWRFVRGIRKRNRIGTGDRSVSCDIQVSVVLNSSEIYNLSPSDIEMQFSCTGRKDGVEYDYQEEVNNWRRIYGMDEQYKSFCCSDTCLPYLSIIAGRNIDNIRSMMQMMENLKDYDSNFLKVAMLRGTMDRIGIEY